MNSDMLALVNAPLANALAINLPAGKSPARRGAKPVYEGDFAPDKLTNKQVRERKEHAIDAKVSSILDYYATTSVPFERIAEHTKIPLERVTAIMAARGRSS